MAKDDKTEGFPVGNQDPTKRGYGKRPERESDDPPPPNRPRGGSPNYGDVYNPKKDK